MKYAGTVVFIFIFCFGCSDSTDNTQLGYRHDLSVSDMQGKPTSEKSFYFDPISFRDTFPIQADNTELKLQTDSLSLEWFSEVLAENHEPILSNYYLGQDIYRLIWLRTFHQSVVIKIIRDKDKWFVETKRSNWIDKNYSVSTKELPVDVVLELQNMLEMFSFFKTESFDWELPGFDGSEWILEAHLANKYHFVNKWSPDFEHSNGLREIGEYIIKISDAKDEEIY